MAIVQTGYWIDYADIVRICYPEQCKIWPCEICSSHLDYFVGNRKQFANSILRQPKKFIVNCACVLHSIFQSH